MGRIAALLVAVVTAVLLSGWASASQRLPANGRIALVQVSSCGEDCETHAVWTLNADGSGLRRLGPGEGAVWAPDGKSIAFLDDDRSYERGVYLMRPDGTARRLLTRCGGYCYRISWRPRTHVLTVEKWDVDGGHFLFDTVRKTRRPFPAGRAGGYFSWAPDGRRLAYAGAGNGVYVVNADGGGRRTVVPAGGCVGNPHPAWSPDGRWIAYSCDRPKDGIWRVHPDGSGRRLLVRGSEYGGQPGYAWSPDATKLAYLFSGSALGILDTHTGKATPVPWRKAGEPQNPDWQPVIRP